MATGTKDLWGLALNQPELHPWDLARAVEDQAREEDPDYRTRLLIRDSVVALRGYWGNDALEDWLSRCPVRSRIEGICSEAFERPGFPSLARRVKKKREPKEIEEFFREVGAKASHPARLCVGGCASLILGGYFSRGLAIIPLVGETPVGIRSLHGVLESLKERYGLEFTHLPSHYLPAGWENRLHSLNTFGSLQVFLVDVYDVFLGKLFSPRRKDRDDLRYLNYEIERETLVRRYKETTASLRGEEILRQRAVDNWYILYGEALPS